MLVRLGISQMELDHTTFSYRGRVTIPLSVFLPESGHFLRGYNKIPAYRREPFLGCLKRVETSEMSLGNLECLGA